MNEILPAIQNSVETAFREVLQYVEMRNDGLPDYLINPNLIPGDLMSQESDKMTRTVESARINLDYSIGYPCINGSVPIWNQLPYEDEFSYNLFSMYLAMHKNLGIVDMGEFLNEQRKKEYEVDIIEIIEECFLFNYWQWRTTAFDKYSSLSVEFKFAKDAIEARGGQVTEITNLKSKLNTHIGKAETWNKLDAGKAIDLLIRISEMEAKLFGFGMETPQVLTNINLTQVNEGDKVVNVNSGGGGGVAGGVQKMSEIVQDNETFNNVHDEVVKKLERDREKERKES